MKKISVKRTAHFKGHKDCIYALCRSSEAGIFYTGAAEGYIVQWNFEQPGDGILLAQVPAGVYFLAMDPDKMWLFAGAGNGNLYIIDLQSRQVLRNIEAHTLGLYHISYLQHHPLILTAGGDGAVRVWKKEDLSLIKSCQASEKSARVIAVSADETEFSAGFSDHYIRSWNLPELKPIHSKVAHSNSVFGLCYSPDGSSLLSGGRDALLKVWNTKAPFEEKRSIPAHLLHIKYIEYNPSGNLFATVSMDKTIKIWDGENFELLKVIDHARYEGHTHSINKLEWVDDRRLITVSDDRSAMMWELELSQ